MRILLVTSSRKITDRAAVAAILRPRYDEDPDTELWHGDAEGGDKLSDALWTYWGGHARPFPADWEHCCPTCPPGHRKVSRRYGVYCPAAGTNRNDDMVWKLAAEQAAGVEVECVAIRQYGAENKGTNHCAGRAKAAGIKVEYYEVGNPQLMIGEAS